MFVIFKNEIIIVVISLLVFEVLEYWLLFFFLRKSLAVGTGSCL